MGGLINRRIVTISALCLVIGTTTTNAAQIFNVTDLGSSFSLKKDDTGYTTAVTSGDGNNSYVFDKYPVNYVYTSTGSQHPQWPDYIPAGMDDVRRMTDTAMSNMYGSVQIVSERYGSIQGQVSEYFVGKGSVPEWFINNSDFYGPLTLTSPVNDFNIHGQVVGTIDYVDAMSSDNGFLNNSISSQLGIHLLNALYIDDQGDIIASGKLESDFDNRNSGDAKYYLLTPNGPPTPAPEPSTLAFLAVGITVVTVRSVHRRRKRFQASA